ncbi:MAG: bifunctional UDP-N-acetylmuramoyl-tripeptide:D-alanyl-D-alanine ligase/alanine racemase [Flammeovirgaceae bacterium]|nr:MAG: bifunctional UDP-N-acetylmuramoyl-tripeptide:D-alanyl-D-alanine ligase/alanine racemase [Flammeovirgaceae bacterium]
MKFSDLPLITGGTLVSLHRDQALTTLITDSRKAVVAEGSVFFAVSGERHDGHAFVRSVYEAGIRQFVVEHNFDWKNYPSANVLRVTSAVRALQQIAAHHRQQFSLPVIGITGSNGKTIVKEWLYQLLAPDYTIVKNPGSYNSQIGVPLSVWQIEPHHQLGIFEAGISKPGEMEHLEAIIKPTYGIFTTIGSAHDEFFENRQQKINEKLKLFRHVKKLIYSTDYAELHQQIKQDNIPAFSWGTSAEADIPVRKEAGGLSVLWKARWHTIQLPFTDEAGIENAMHGVALLLLLGYELKQIQKRLLLLRSVPMRLEVKEGINNCLIINDAYNNDLAGLQISLDFLAHQRQRSKRTVILSDILQSGLNEEKLAQTIAGKVAASGVQRLIGIGSGLSAHQKYFTIPSVFYSSTEEFISRFSTIPFSDEVVLVKGSRPFQFEKIAALLQRKVHGTVLEIDLGAVVHNLNFFKSKLKAETKLMVMVKALAYGSGSVQLAGLLQYHRVHYLGVAYADEGADLRQNNIVIPIMVMNPSPESFESLMNHKLEPSIYGLPVLKELIRFLNGRPMTIHIKLNTGMHRLGFDEDNLPELLAILAKHDNLNIASVFSHLSGADDEQFDSFTALQAGRFQAMSTKLEQVIKQKPLLHLVNTAGILRFPQYHFDMVRLGIGLYGVEPVAAESNLKQAVTLKTTISQIRNIKAGESVGYSRKGISDKERTIATIAIGYADGYSRAFGNGKGIVLVNGKRAPVVGNVCMDMTMIDVTGINAREGDNVIIFGNGLPVTEVAERIGTIPYEILTSTSDRVRRVFVAEGI